MAGAFCGTLLWGMPARAETLLVFGDSLAAGYGLANGEGWVALTTAGLGKTHPGWRVVNASVSGETTAGGLSRLPAVLAREKPDAVLIELGANDGLRGLPLKDMKTNLTRMVRLSKGAGVKRVAVMEMYMPPNYGPDYASGFKQTFTDVAKTERAALTPFFLYNIALNPASFQADGIHPNADAQTGLVRMVAPTFRWLVTGR